MGDYKAHFIKVDGLVERELRTLDLGASNAIEAFDEATLAGAADDSGANTIDICIGSTVVDRIRIASKPGSET